MWFSDSDWWKFISFVILFGMFLGWVVFEGIPWLWHFLKPFIHSVTA